MFQKNMEVWDPKHPSLYYYTNHSVTKPRSFVRSCSFQRPRALPSSHRLMLVFAVLYVVYMLYLAICKPQFALDFVRDKQRQSVFSHLGISIVGSLVLSPLTNTQKLQLVLRNPNKQDMRFSIQRVSYHFLIGLSRSEQRSISLPLSDKPLLMKSKGIAVLTYTIPIPEGVNHQDLPPLSVDILIKSNKPHAKEETKTLVIQETL